MMPDPFPPAQVAAMEIVDHIGHGCELLARAADACLATLPPPTFNAEGPRPRWEFELRDRRLAVVLIASKALSSVHAACILWRHSHLQECWALIRIVQDCCDDVLLLTTPFDAAELSTLQRAKLDEFFHAGPYDRASPTEDPVKPKMVSRDKIAADLGNKLSEAPGARDPDTVIKTIRKLHALHSGYVHANYWRIAEMVSGRNGSEFHLNALGTPSQIQSSDLVPYLLEHGVNAGVSIRSAARLVDSRHAHAMTLEADKLFDEARRLDEVRRSMDESRPGV